MCIEDVDNRILARIPCTLNRLYVLNTNVTHPVCLLVCEQEVASRWHAHFGHLDFQGVKKMATGGWVHCLPQIDQVDQLCDGCLADNRWHTPFPEQTECWSKRALELVHGNPCGPITSTTPSRKKLSVLLVDDYNHFMWVVLIRAKDDALEAIKRVRAKAALLGR
jgi:hypothetical protein